MEYPITQLSAYAESILESLTAGTVHSVYRRTINLTDGRQILSLQTEHSPLSPISLISGLNADEFGALSVKTGDEVCFHKDGLTIRNAGRNPRAAYQFTCKDFRVYDLKLSTPLNAPSRLTLTANIQKAVSCAETGGLAALFHPQAGPPLLSGDADGQKPGADSDLSFVLLAARNYLLRCNEFILAKKYPEAASELIRLLGLGCGLTPSGDDFLCGVLAGFLFSGNTEHPFAKRLRDIVADKLADTIDISAAFLSCALKNQFSLPVVRLYRLPPPEEILASFGAVGHSSGIDTLCGLLWCLTHI